MIEIIPAIDLIKGRCVRLSKGDFGRVTSYSDDPVETARSFEASGIKRLHVVDLDGARSGSPGNIKVLRQLISSTSLKIDFGGGIRTRSNLEEVLGAGANMVSIGSMAVGRPEILREWIGEFGPERFFIGADVKGDCIAYHGWQTESAIHWSEFIGQWMGAGIINFFCTDVERDGELTGPAIGLYQDILKQFPGIRLVGSGGVSSEEDIRALDAIGLEAVIVGKAIYEGKIRMDDRRPTTDDR
ncbi:MAG TPA: 1-(5-phosphoribosyl)-5-[(5-phosphoribosylamino)methylideneamino]imidazole-4-carboxamide isomerase [Bacteroidales bacterium]|nr:1-(5-phosphoribosyl)-5-[(5-phosphoribosylamino)methylideneamino]imidazole-4-carboxamide isomerase [Bacteroidales bacterium]